MEKIRKGKIANAITSAAMNHIVATADDIYDETLQRYQSEINRTHLSSGVVSGDYNSTNHTIELFNAEGEVVSAIDAAPFIKDGMVDTVAIVNGYLVITFNADAAKQPISIALTDIFDPDLYYTKQEVDDNTVPKSLGVVAGVYNISGDTIELYNSNGQVVSTINAAPFTKDGMVESVEIDNGYLVVTFNADAGKNPISIPLSDIFNPDLYYTKQEVDDNTVAKSLGVVSGVYNATGETIQLFNTAGEVVSEIDAIPFIKDGMVDTVTVSNGYLVITFNADAGKQPINVALADIFDPDQYYTKQEVDDNTVAKSLGVVSGDYNSQNHVIELLNGNNEIVSTIDATPFIKDGMVSAVTVNNGYLVITFNTDADKEPINVPLSEIFNPDLYYTKQEVDENTVSKAAGVVSGFYNVTGNTITLLNSDGETVSEINATPFTKDGMVESVGVVGNYLVVTFNADANKQPINIPLTDIFDPEQYYTKQEIDENTVSRDSGVTFAEYNSTNHTIELFNSDNYIVSTIDATPFIKDGMVDSVTVSNGYLVVTFNADADKQPINIPLTDIFNPALYYTKQEVDDITVAKVSTPNKIYGTDANGAQTTYDTTALGTQVIIRRY